MIRAVGERGGRWGVAALGSLLAACGGTGPGAAASPQTTCPIAVAVAAPTFSGTVLPMLRQTCGANSPTSCHGSPSPVGHVSYSPSLTDTDVWSQLVNVVPANAPPNAGWMRVAPDDVPHSWLIEKVTKDDPGGTGQAYGNRMPLGLPDLCDATVQTLKNWINRGAPDD
ncbi:MAG TPA: hypothetical protein VEP68_07660 [Anaeromyxobacteraceae bacterium]|nr:hypothetical protein [Anaeromyxobacteraceae bacterium]